MPGPRDTSHPTRRLSVLVRAGLAAGGAGVAVLAGSVAYVRSVAAGHLFGEQDVPAAPVALVLGARVYPDGTPSTFLAARLDIACRLHASGTVRAILVSGDSLAPEYDEPEAMRRYLVRAGVPDASIVTDPAGFDTYDSCVRARRVFLASDVIVVSQSYHLPRAVATARRVGLSAVGVGDDTCRALRRPWLKGVVRDQVACVKTVLDLARSRVPVLGPVDRRLQQALAAD